MATNGRVMFMDFTGTCSILPRFNNDYALVAIKFQYVLLFLLVVWQLVDLRIDTGDAA